MVEDRPFGLTFMARHLLIAYLNVTVLMGPGLCCCSAHFLFPGSREGGCCSRSHGQAASDSHLSHHHHDASHHDHAAIADKPPQSPTPCEDGREDCPCGRHQQTLFASQPCDASAMKPLDIRSHSIWSLDFDFAVPTAAAPDGQFSLTLGHFRPGELNGRGILRAHHRLQC